MRKKNVFYDVFLSTRKQEVALRKAAETRGNPIIFSAKIRDSCGNGCGKGCGNLPNFFLAFDDTSNGMDLQLIWMSIGSLKMRSWSRSSLEIWSRFLQGRFPQSRFPQSRFPQVSARFYPACCDAAPDLKKNCGRCIDVYVLSTQSFMVHLNRVRAVDAK